MSTDPPTTESSVSQSSGWFTVLPALVTPICLGLSLYFGVQYLIQQEHITNETVLRYVNGHPVSRLTVGMFLIGLASLVMIAFNVFSQFASEGQIYLQDLSPNDHAAKRETESPKNGIVPQTQSPGSQYPQPDSETAIDHGEALVDLPRAMHHHYLWGRLVNSLHYIYRTGSVIGVEDEMKYLADMDIERQQQRYSLSRILIWATPMLGFLGTVLGISQALGGISVGPDNDFQQMMGGLQSSLYVAFDTTALALTLSMVLMFCQFLVDRFEVQLLELVDQKTRGEIARHFDLSGAAGGNDAIGATGIQVLEATRDVVRDQTEIWRRSIQAAEDAWTATLTQTSDVVRENLTEALDINVENLAHYLGESIEKADQSIAHRWEQWQTMLSNNARMMKEHQESLLSQTEKIQTVVQALDQSTTCKTAMEQQHQAIEATTKMHDVLARVANEVASQSKQLQQQGSRHAELVEKSNEVILKSQASFEQSVSSFQSDLPVAIAMPSTAQAVDNGSRSQPASEAALKPASETVLKPASHTYPADVSFTRSAIDHPAPVGAQNRRRNSKKPVMFLPSEAVTEIREQTKAIPAQTVRPAPSSPSFSPMVTDSVSPSVPRIVNPSSVNKDKPTISIHDLRERLGMDPVKETADGETPTLLMPQNRRSRRRVRPAVQDDANRLLPVRSDNVQRKKAA